MELKIQIKTLPTQPGVYQYYDKNGTILYIGKANKLANRINQHIKGNSSDLKNRLQKYNINIEDCLLSYHYIDDNLDDNTNLLFEDIVTRILKPGFVRRIG